MTRYHQYEAPLLAHSVLDCQRSFTHTLLCALLRRQIRGIGAFFLPHFGASYKSMKEISHVKCLQDFAYHSY